MLKVTPLINLIMVQLLFIYIYIYTYIIKEVAVFFTNNTDVVTLFKGVF